MIARNALLREPDGRRLFLSQLTMHVGTTLALVALPWLVLEQGGSKALAGLAATIGVVPYALFGIFAGVVGDRVPRRRLLVVSYVAQAVAAATIPLWALVAEPPTALILASGFLVGLGRTFADAATFGAVSEVLPREDFVEGQAALSVAFAIGNVTGPFLGGVLVAVLGGAGTLGVQAVFLTAGTLVALRLSRPFAAVAAAHGESVLASVRAGIHVIVREPRLRLLTGIGGVWFGCVYGPVQGLLVAYYKEEVALSGRLLGVAMGVAGVFGIFGGITVGVLARRLGGGRLIAFGIVASGIATLGLAGAHSLWSALPAAALLGYAIQITLAALVGERQRQAPRELQARVGVTGRAFLLAASVAGGFAASGLATAFSLRELYVGVGVTALAIAVLAVPAILRGAVGVPRTSEAPTPVEP